MKWQNLLTNLLTTVGLMGLGIGSPALAQTTNPAAPLNIELNQAVCQQDWTRAIRVIDRMRPQTPADRRGELTVYRSRLQALLNSGTPIPNWQCGAGGASLSTAPTGTTVPSNSAIVTNSSPASNPNSVSNQGTNAGTNSVTNSTNDNDSTIQGVRRAPSNSGNANSATGSNTGRTSPTGTNNIGTNNIIDRARNLNQTINNP